MTRPAPRSWRAAALAVAALALCAGGARGASEPTTQLEFGVQMAQRGLWHEAMFRFERARAAAPRDVRVLNNLAVAYEAVGRFDDALATYRDALAVAPDERRLRQNYTRFVEFYQAFRPAQPGPAEAEAAAAAETPAEAQP